MDNAGALVGPLLAAALLKLAFSDERTVFLLAAVPGVAAIVVLWLAVPDTVRRIDPAPAIAGPRSRLPAQFWKVIAVFAFFTLSITKLSTSVVSGAVNSSTAMPC